MVDAEARKEQLRGIGLLGIDIDGTMLRFDGSLSDRTRRVLHDADAAGIHVVPTTGRPYVVSLEIIQALGIRNFWIFANGAITRHIGREETVRAQWMEADVAKEFVRRLRDRLDGVRFAVEFEVDVAFEHGFEDRVPSVPPGEPIDDVVPAIAERVQKVLVFDSSKSATMSSADDLDRLYASVVDALDGSGVASYSGLSFIEISAAEVTKATALSLLASDLGLNASNVATFGDNHNDVPMLEWAGSSFAMGNATDDAKAAAGEVLGHTDDDGLAQLVEEILAARE